MPSQGASCRLDWRTKNKFGCVCYDVDVALPYAKAAVPACTPVEHGRKPPKPRTWKLASVVLRLSVVHASGLRHSKIWGKSLRVTEAVEKP